MNVSVIPLELLGHILGHLDSTQALYSAITSSSIFSKAFYASRIQILTSLVHQMIPRGARKHAVAILYAPYITDEDRLGDLWAFLDSYFGDTRGDIFPFPHDVPNLTKLVKLASRVSRFEREYFEDTMTCLTTSEEQHPSVRPLTYTKHTRIQRAFFRFDLYCRCFVIVEGESEIPDFFVPAMGQFHHFLSLMQPWEVEEMSSIHTYLASRVGSIINKMEDEIISIVLEHRVKLENQVSQKSQGLCSFLDWSFSDLFSSDGRQEIYAAISFFISRGLEFLTELFHAQGQAQRDLLLSTDTGRREFLPQAIQYGINNQNSFSSVEVENQDVATASSDNGDSDESSHMNFGFSEFSILTGYQPITSGVGRRPGRSEIHGQYSALRRLGYVFWDKERISEKYTSFSDMPDENSKELDLSHRKSAEWVLRRVMFPREIIKELEQKYGLKDTWPSSAEESDGAAEVGT